MRSALLLAITALPFLGGALKISTSGRCGTQSKTLTCKGSSFGNCCSGSGWCGSTSAYCDKDCQVGFGDCKSVPVKSSSAKLASTKLTSTKSPISSTSSAKAIVVSVAPTSVTSTRSPASTPVVPTATASAIGNVKVSTDGTCGGAEGFTCAGSTFGNCCSAYGWCGSTTGHCDAGCNAVFGICGSTSPSATPASVSSSSAPSSFVTSTKTASAAPAPTEVVSTSGQCGSGLTCLGSTFGDCCSAYGYW